MPDRGQDLADAIELAAVSPCFDRASLADEIERWLERRVVDSRLRVKVTRTPDALSFAIALGDRPAQFRDFEEVPRDCPGERRMLALSIALAIDAVSPKTGRERSSARFAFFVDGMVGTSTSDRPALGAGLDARARLGPIIWPGIGVFATVTKDQPVSAGLAARFDTSIVAARLEVCGVLPAARMIDVAACAESLLGSSEIVAKGVDQAASDAQFWSAAALSVELHLRFTHAFGIRAAIEGVVSLRPGHVEVLDQAGEVAARADLPTFGAALRLGPSVSF